MPMHRLRLNLSDLTRPWLTLFILFMGVTSLGAETVKNTQPATEREIEPRFLALMAQTPAISPIQKSQDAAAELRKFTDPEIQLAREISTSLSELERYCSKAGGTSTPSNSATPNSTERSSRLVDNAQSKSPSDVPRLIAIDSAMLEVSIQAASLEADMRRYRIARGLDQPGLCALLPESWRLNAQCNAYNMDQQRLRLVQAESSRYYKTVEYKYKIYKLTQDLELRGCTRPGFTFRLWQADQRYLQPRLKMSASWFGQVLNAR